MEKLWEIFAVAECVSLTSDWCSSTVTALNYISNLCQINTVYNLQL